LDEGVAINTQDLPKAYEDVIEGLEPQEIAVIVDVTRRFHQAKQSTDGPDLKMFIPPL
jgi:hypothetical protein